MSIFGNIDFNNLPEDYNESSVREEIVAPLLKILGYSSSDKENHIIREPHLEHPFTQIGTKSYRVTERPDYLIQVKGKNAFIIEAKSPKQNIRNGKHVEQAYSYAINRQVQVQRFVLCNGKEINIFDVNKIESVLHFNLATATEDNWGKVFELLSPMAFINPNIFNYKLDYGIWCVRNGIKQDVLQNFYNCYITYVGRLEDNVFTFMTVVKKDEELLASFDFEMSLFEDFMKQVPDKLKEKVKIAIRKSPFRYIANSEEESFPLNFSAYLSGKIQRNENEEYLPLKVKEFI